MTGTSPRAGSRHFSLAAREAVAGGDPFDHLHRGEFRRRSDDRDLLAALLLAEGKGGETAHLTAGGVHAARQLGHDIAGYGGGRAARELCDLGQFADMGGCRTTAALRAALLGTVAPRDYGERDEAGAGIPLGDFGPDGMFSDDGC